MRFPKPLEPSGKVESETKPRDIIEIYPPVILWGFNCNGDVVPHTVSSGSVQAMLTLHKQGRILELCAYRYMIQQLCYIPNEAGRAVYQGGDIGEGMLP